MTLRARLELIGELLDKHRRHMRPDGDLSHGAIRVALDQAIAEADAMGVPPKPTPIEVELRGLRADLAELKNLPQQMHTVRADVTAMRDAVGV